MQALKFNLSGKTAFFKKPDVNTYRYFTYSHIHKVALMGIFGAICGFSGYNEQKITKADFPEFYERFKDIRIAVIPSEGSFSKKVQNFNNSVGYASKEQGNNLIVKEQWLENPAWKIYVLNDNTDVYNELSRRIINSEYKYIPYLGKNDHYANISDVEVVEVVELEDVNKSEHIDSMFVRTIARSIKLIDEDNVDSDVQFYLYEEFLPIELDKQFNQYVTEKYALTNGFVDIIDYTNIFKAKDKILHFS